MGTIDWAKVLLPDTPPLEIFVRGTVMYLALFVLLRVVLRRQSGTVGITDLLVVVMIADAAQNGMASDYTSIADGVLLVITIIGWSYVLDWLGYHFSAFQRFLLPPPLLLVQNGKMLRRNMRQELITVDELMGQLRQQGVESLDGVKAVYMEGDGRFSVITQDRAQHSAPERKAS